ncbi:3481_t:CDS:2 [Acaulospora colombiana]|uniref:3481_t:CDS:1 n=1 Tax=Acaulospora colombiana TaxID=27376 RepID=A0ACA9PMX8_9GLOM|nr:3481_t:CDS:2 [Acaulospora colombiana]
MATCASVRVCDVPIDLDGTSTEFTLLDFFEQEQDQKATSTQQQQVPLPPQRQASTTPRHLLPPHSSIAPSVGGHIPPTRGV